MRLIDGEHLVWEIEQIHCKECDNEHYERCKSCWVAIFIDYIENAATYFMFNETPVVHGHWILFDDDWNAYKCSVCGEIWQINSGTPEENKMHYCQNCGAKMDEEVTDNDI